MTFENVYVGNFQNALRGMRNPMSGWLKSDTDGICVGKEDQKLADRLVKAGSPHRKFLRQIFVGVDILKAPAYWLHEFATYKVGTTLDCSSTMHKLTSRPLGDLDFESPETDVERCELSHTIRALNKCRQFYLLAKDSGGTEEAERYFRMMKRTLPHSYLYERLTWTANYEVLRNIWKWRHNHRLPVWRQFCEEFIESLPGAKDWIVSEDFQANGSPERETKKNKERK